MSYYCDYCGKNIQGVKQLNTAIIIDNDIYYDICKSLNILNPHKNCIRRWFWMPDYPFQPKIDSKLSFCNQFCFERWKAFIQKHVEEALKQGGVITVKSKRVII